MARIAATLDAGRLSDGDSAGSQRWHPAAVLWGQLIAGASAAGALAWLLRLLIDRSPVQGAWTIQVLIALATLVSSCWQALYRRRFWSEPTSRLTSLISRARQGEAPIEELSEITGGVEPLVPIVQGLLRDLRQQRAKLAAIESEMSQRVANRTGALERQLSNVRTQATRDPLTGLMNRRAMELHLPQAIEAFKAGGVGLCMLMIDMDNFKTLNDTLGHGAGDELLKQLGQIIRSNSRENDAAFRCGGDEFVILLHDADIKTGAAMADRLTKLVDELVKPLQVTLKPRLSIGVCGVSELESPTPEGLMEVADRRLYAVKATRPGARRGACANS